jgi:hypothetical protein
LPAKGADLHASRSFRRISAILTVPGTEWPNIDAEPTTRGTLYRDHVLVLTAIGPIASLGRAVVEGASLATALPLAALAFALSIAALEILAWAIYLLAPRFGGRSDRIAALKLAAYSSTPAWLARILLVAPGFLPAAIGLILSLYGFVLLGLGLPKLMGLAGARAVYCLAALIALMLLGNLVLFVMWRTAFG